MSSPSLQESDDSDNKGEVAPDLDDSGSTSESEVEGMEEEEEEAVCINNDFDPGLEALYQQQSSRKTDTEDQLRTDECLPGGADCAAMMLGDRDELTTTDDAAANCHYDSGKTHRSRSPSCLQGAVALTQDDEQDLSRAIAESVSNALSVDTEQRPTNIVINNPQVHFTKKTEVANLNARYATVGGQQVIQSSTSTDGGERQQNNETRPTRTLKDPAVQRIRDETVSDIQTWTSGMIKTQFVDDIVKKMDAGQNWITVTGSGGDGKTTVAYMVLHEMMKRGREVFRVKTVEQYHTITKNTHRSLLMMNDVLGAFALDKIAFSTWKPVIFDAMENISKAKESEQPSGVICMLVQRSNILNEVEPCLEKHKRSILGVDAVTNLSCLPVEEKGPMLDYHLKQKNIKDIPETEKLKVIQSSIPYGFPHCCKLFAELKSEEKCVDIVQFFSRPLEILDATTDAYLDNEKLKDVFKTLLKRDGRLDTSEIEDDDQRSGIIEVSAPLNGSYLSNTNGVITFSHPSVYESVANCIGKRDVVFAIKYFSFSFIMEKMRFAESQSHDSTVSRNVFKISPNQQNIQRLCNRFTLSVIYRRFNVLRHPFFQSEDFCRTFFSSIIEKDSFWNNFICLCCKETGRLSVNDSNEDGETMLLQVAQSSNTTATRILLECGASVNPATTKTKTALHYLCESGHVDASDVELMIQHGADVNKADLFGKAALHYLCEGGDVDASVVELMIQHGADVNKADVFGNTALHYLCESGGVDASVVELMIQHGADVNKADKRGKTALHYLCESGDVDASVVELMIQHGADVNKADKRGKTALHYLCESGDVDASVVELMIQHGADVNKIDRRRKTALHYLCERFGVDASVVELMIQHGADVNKIDRRRKTALHCLCESGGVDASVVELMIQHGADVNKADVDEKTAFHYLCESGGVDASIVELMIQHGADVNKADRHGKTAIHYLCESGGVDASVVELMIQHGADVNKADVDEKTALHYLCESGSVDASEVELMIQHGADVNKADRDGKTAFHYLCERFGVDASVVELMIQHGADVTKADVDEKTAFHYLCASGGVDASVVELMIQHGADVNKADGHGKTALHYLCESGGVDASVVELMIQHGADVTKADVDEKTAFHYLCESGCVDASVVELMIQHGADVNKADVDEKTAFHYLCESGDVDASVVELMIQHGADVNKADGHGKTALHSV
ncbi:ankyrin repeat and KH domain-containing protein mask-like isoform X1 [Haliotis rufescens]|uniref:ankyrin repeat and KH domain-containing protein mask-like isoform X1 n=2 Tax=Haliotis rufescens TaxID=6454 RepID=UPI00201EE79F|nr:ankyrin repeat and KH domain-containing protein mask-like isoform X1 [Haliotis rufescens]